VKPLPLRALEASLVATVAALALLHVSPNTTDPDLWGHVLFGYRALSLGNVERVEPFSWTAAGEPWINHEVLAEVALALAHKAGGGSGLLVLKIVVGMLAMGIAVALGAEERTREGRLTTWAVGAACAVEVGFGFAARPQIFTAVFLVALIGILRIALGGAGRPFWLLAVPLLFVPWFNTHGGAILGLTLLAAASLAVTADRLLPMGWLRARFPPAPPRVAVSLWAATALALAASVCTPWGTQLPRWLIRSVFWSRPEIAEWNPPALSWDHAIFPIVAVAWVATLLFSRRPARLWESAMVAVLLVAAGRHVRHTPLFCLVAAATLPAPLLDCGRRALPHCPGLIRMVRNRTAVLACTTGLWLLTAAALITAFLSSARPFTMTVPVSQYPVHAVQFIEKSGLRGNLLVHFDWGEMCLWSLPQCRVSIDGRLDTCYPRHVIDAHWRIYETGRAPTQSLDMAQADIALLRTDTTGTAVLAADPSWTTVYRSYLATVLVRNRDGNPAPDSPVVTHKEEGIGPGRFAFPECAPRERLPARSERTPRAEEAR
jgi:hypothetical protein